jgi:hypothetical protein
LPTEATLLRFVPESSYLTVKLPKLYVVAVHELLGAFFRRVVVRAFEIDGPNNVVVVAHEIRTIFGH